MDKDTKSVPNELGRGRIEEARLLLRKANSRVVHKELLSFVLRDDKLTLEMAENVKRALEIKENERQRQLHELMDELNSPARRKKLKAVSKLYYKKTTRDLARENDDVIGALCRNLKGTDYEMIMLSLRSLESILDLRRPTDKNERARREIANLLNHDNSNLRYHAAERLRIREAHHYNDYKANEMPAYLSAHTRPEGLDKPKP